MSPATSQPQGQPLRAEFLVSAPRLADCPPADGVEIAFVGRSNAGKSSVLNCLTGTRNLARVSRTPGRTQLINFFDLGGGDRLVDLPGYGYAQAPKAMRRNWQQHLDDFLSHREPLVAIVLIMDCRHPLKDADRLLLEWSTRSAMPVLALLNKCDKLKRNAQQKTLATVRQSLRAHPNVDAMMFSATDRIGLSDALAWINARRADGVPQQIDADDADDADPTTHPAAD